MTLNVRPSARLQRNRKRQITQTMLHTMARLTVLAALVAMALGTGKASASEICRFAGSTDYAGHVAVTTEVAATGSLTKVDVTATFEATTMFWLHVRYLVEEVSDWQAGRLASVALNTRYLLGGQIVRQQWDNFVRGPEGLQGYRVQAKTLADFRRRHPGFVQHWDPATFGQPWLPDYQFASPERRADLDLRGSSLPSSLRSPLAMTFYWVRWLPPEGQDVAVFLPGFKAERLVDLAIKGASFAGGMTWQAPVHYPAFSERPVSTATAWTSADGHLLQLAFDLHEPDGSARGLISQEGCVGVPVAPAR